MRETTSSDQDYEQLDLLLRGFQVSRLLRLVADLQIADEIALDCGILLADVAVACSVLSEPLLRVLRALAAFDIFKTSADGVSHTSARVDD